MTKKLIIMRGPSGSGKSSLVKELTQEASDNRKTCTVHSTDDFHLELKDGIFVYVFKPEKLRAFHQANLHHATTSMEMGLDYVIIDNTNTTWKEIEPYVLVGIGNGYEIVIKEPNTSWKFDAAECARKNTHGVPVEAVARMLQRWEKTSVIESKVKQLESKRGKTS